MYQFLPAFILFLGSRRFHSDFGFFGPIVDARLCRQGGEWYVCNTSSIREILTAIRVPSMLVQLFWTAVVGPWILWKIRKVNDVHAWAWQTRLAVLAGFVGPYHGSIFIELILNNQFAWDSIVARFHILQDPGHDEHKHVLPHSRMVRYSVFQHRVSLY